MDEAEKRQDYYLAEYREAANAYFKGVDIGYTGIKGYITINSLFVALIVGLSEYKGTALNFLGDGDIVRPIPALALWVFLCVLLILRHYFKHLNSCRDRCEAIEKKWDGLLFTRLKNISSTTSAGAVVGALLIFCSIAVVWIYLAYHLRTIEYILGR